MLARIAKKIKKYKYIYIILLSKILCKLYYIKYIQVINYILHHIYT